MKRVLLLFIVFLSLNAMAQTGINVFDYGANGEVISSKTFISQEMYWDNNWPLVADTTFTINSKDKSHTYQIVLKKVMNDSTSEGHFNSIQIFNTSNNESLFVLKNVDDWCHTNIWSYGRMDAKYMLVQLSESASALIFTGWRYDSTPPLTTIIILNDGRATLVFNKNCNVLDYQQTSSNFSFTYAEIFQDNDGNDHFIPADKDLKKFRIWKEGEMLKYAALN